MRRLVGFPLLLLAIVACQDGPNPLEVGAVAPPPQPVMGVTSSGPAFWFDPSSNWGQASGWVLGSEILTIEVDDPAWASEMEWMGEELVRQIRTKLETDQVRGLKVRIARAS